MHRTIDTTKQDALRTRAIVGFSDFFSVVYGTWRRLEHPLAGLSTRRRLPGGYTRPIALWNDETQNRRVDAITLVRELADGAAEMGNDH